MKPFGSQLARNELAKRITDAPKEERRVILTKARHEDSISRGESNEQLTALVNRIVELYEYGPMVKIIQYTLLYPDDPSRARRYDDERNVWEKFEEMVDLIKSINDRETALNLVKRKGRLLYFMSDEFKNDPEIVIAALRTGTEMYEFLSEELKNNREVALAAAGDPEVTRGTNDVGKAMELPEKFRKDKIFIIEFLRRNGHQLCGMTLDKKNFPELERFKHDKDVVLAAVGSTHRAIQSIPEELKNDRDVVLTAVRRDGTDLGYWSYKGFNIGEGYNRNLCNDIEIATEALKQNPEAIEYVGDNIKDDPRILALIPKE